ncbi:MAG: hypothetical protein ABUJ98_14765 [Hyphomicrobium sp.]
MGAYARTLNDKLDRQSKRHIAELTRLRARNTQLVEALKKAEPMLAGSNHNRIIEAHRIINEALAGSE